MNDLHQIWRGVLGQIIIHYIVSVHRLWLQA